MQISFIFLAHTIGRALEVYVNSLYYYSGITLLCIIADVVTLLYMFKFKNKWALVLSIIPILTSIVVLIKGWWLVLFKDWSFPIFNIMGGFITLSILFNFIVPLCVLYRIIVPEYVLYRKIKKNAQSRDNSMNKTVPKEYFQYKSAFNPNITNPQTPVTPPGDDLDIMK